MYRHSCSNCAMNEICLPLGVGGADIDSLEQIVKTTTVKHVGDKIILQGDPFQNVYVLKSGMCKSYRFDEAGNEYLQSFHLPGELFGLEAIYAARYGFTVEVLDTSVVCEMDYGELKDLCSRVPALQHQLFNLLSREIYTSQVNLIEHFDQTAQQKLAGFLHNLFSRFQARGQTGLELKLSMSRRDIAHHLGLAPETISRLLKRFQENGVISIDNRFVTIENLDRLETMINCHAMEASIKKEQLSKLG